MTSSFFNRFRHRLARAITGLGLFVRPTVTPKCAIDPNVVFPGCRCYKTSLGRFLVPDEPKEDVIAQHIRNDELFDEPIITYSLGILSEGDCVIDVGANFGQFTIAMARHVGPKGHVYAIEADPFICSILRKNIELNALKNVTIIEAAAHETSGMELPYPKPDFREFNTYGSYGLDPSSTSLRRVKTIRIDDLPMGPLISLIKIDVQGCDLFAMRGAWEVISQSKPTLIFEYEEQFQGRFKTCFQDYVDFIREVGYQFDSTIMSINFVARAKRTK